MPKPGIIPIRLDPATANVSSMGSLALLSVSFWLLARQQPNYATFQLIHVLFFLLGLPVLVAFHEAVHALAGMHFGRLPLKAFSFGIFWHSLMPYCHCREGVSVHAYRRVLLMPLLLTPPFFIGLLFYHPALWTSLLAALSLSGCMGDILIYRELRSMKQNDLVLDCPDEAGCDIVVKEET